MKYHYYGHSCFMVETGGLKLLFDPFISPNPLANNIVLANIEADYIFVSHGHEDHVADLLTIASLTKAKVICSWEIMKWLEKEGYTHAHPMNTGGSFGFEFGRVKCTVAQHSSSMPDGSYGGNPMGFIVFTPEGNFYYAGDTALTLDMQLIPGWGNIHFAIMPIGDNFTMDVEDAILASDFVECDKVLGYHYDTFGYIEIDHKEAIQKFFDKGKDLMLLKIGESIEL